MNPPLPEVSLSDIIAISRAVLKYLDRHRVKKTPIKKFFRELEKKLKVSLSDEQKEKIVRILEKEGRIIESKSRGNFVISRPIREMIE